MRDSTLAVFFSDSGTEVQNALERLEMNIVEWVPDGTGAIQNWKHKRFEQTTQANIASPPKHSIKKAD